MERELDMFVMSRPQDRDDGGNTAAVREAQRRARRRALSQRKLDAAAGGDQGGNAAEVGLDLPGAWYVHREPEATFACVYETRIPSR